MTIRSLSLLIASSFIFTGFAQANDRAMLRDFGGWYEGRFTGTFEDDSVSGDGRVRLPRGNWRRIVIQVDDFGIRRDITGTVNRIRCRGKRVTYSGRVRAKVEGVSVTGNFSGTARQNSSRKVLRIPVRLSREILGERYTATGRFKGTQ